MIRAYVLIVMTAGRSRDLVNTIRHQEGIRSADRVTGPYDVIVDIEAATVDSISDLVSNTIHPVKGVVRTITCVCVG